ncbi:hypothetical protein [Streptomyces umbrinus]|uniref:hypothetical protein n=1 Tax=Streptomyces umbrinus TaxID=67370 RepID=UPI00342CDF43
MALERTLRAPIELPDPVIEKPKPVQGCDVCGACGRQWVEATDPNSPAYDLSHAVDLAIEISRHPHDWKKKTAERRRKAAQK